MDFDPANRIVQLCLQGNEIEEKGDPDGARLVFNRAWQESTTDLERFIAAHFVARNEPSPPDQLRWLETMLALGLKMGDAAARSALPGLYHRIGACHEELTDEEKARLSYDLAASYSTTPDDPGPFYHGTKADLKVGDTLTAGFGSNYKADLTMNHIYFTALIRGAGLAAALARGDGRERVYVVEPTGQYEHDPNVTDKKFPGNLTRSYRTAEPLTIVGEVENWKSQSPDDLRKWREKLARNEGDIIN